MCEQTKDSYKKDAVKNQEIQKLAFERQARPCGDAKAEIIRLLETLDANDSIIYRYLGLLKQVVREEAAGRVPAERV